MDIRKIIKDAVFTAMSEMSLSDLIEDVLADAMSDFSIEDTVREVVGDILPGYTDYINNCIYEYIYSLME